VSVPVLAATMQVSGPKIPDPAIGTDDAKARCDAVVMELEEVAAGLIAVIDRPFHVRRRGKRRL